MPWVHQRCSFIFQHCQLDYSQDYRMSATGYEETDLSYHVPDDEEHEREENGEGEYEEEDEMRDHMEDGIKDVREQSASPPRDDENNLRLEESQHQVPEESRDCASDGGEEHQGNQGPPVMTIPPHVLSQILSSPGFSLQVIWDTMTSYIL